MLLELRRKIQCIMITDLFNQHLDGKIRFAAQELRRFFQAVSNEQLVGSRMKVVAEQADEMRRRTAVHLCQFPHCVLALEVFFQMGSQLQQRPGSLFRLHG